MDILINELSLDGQFENEEDFLDNLEDLLHHIKLIDSLNFILLKEYSFFNCQITGHQNFMDIAKSKDNRVRRLKSFLLKLSNQPPFWNETQVHCCQNDTYSYNAINICNTSLAESSQRDSLILSFNHNDFLCNELEIKKNVIIINICNFIDKNYFLDYLLSISEIELLTYCQFKYKKTNLNFSKIEEGYGFDSLDGVEQVEEYLSTFNMFHKMSWEEILVSDSLEYKKYNKPRKKKIMGWFREDEYANTDIYKFRTSQKYRCFGYREEDEFFVLRFEIDHRISDNG